MISAKAEGHDRICIGFALPAFGGGAKNPILTMGGDVITKIQEELKVDQSFEYNVRLATSPAELLTPGAEPFILQLLKGIQVSVKVNMWKKLADVMMKLVEAGELDSSLLPLLGGIAPAALLKVKGTLDIEVDDHMKNMITTNPLVEPLLMDASTLISSVSGVSDDDEIEAFIDNELRLPPPPKKIIKFLIQHLGDEIDFVVCHPQFGVKGRIDGKGLATGIKNAIKFLPK